MSVFWMHFFQDVQGFKGGQLCATFPVVIESFLLTDLFFLASLLVLFVDLESTKALSL